MVRENSLKHSGANMYIHLNYVITISLLSHENITRIYNISCIHC